MIVSLMVSLFSHMPIRYVKRMIKTGPTRQSDSLPAIEVTSVFSHTGDDLSRLFLSIFAKIFIIHLRTILLLPMNPIIEYNLNQSHKFKADTL